MTVAPPAVARRRDARRTTTWSSPIVGLTLLGACLVVLADAKLGRQSTWLAVGVVAAVAALALWQRDGRAAGWMALIVGAAGLMAGIGIGLRRLAAEAVDTRAVVATVALIVALAVVAAGIHRIVGHLPRLPAISWGSLLVVAVVLAVWTLTPAIIATNVPELTHGAAAPADFGFDAREVRFEAADGVELWAWYSPPPAGKVVVLRHGAGSTASDVLAHASVLVDSGYGVLLTDARGHGLSEGTAMDFGWHGNVDIEAAVTFLLAQPEVDPDSIGVVGLSMGGEEAIGAAANDDRIAVVVAEGATARIDADKEWLVDEYGFRGWTQTKLEWIQYAFAGLLTDARKPQSLASAARDASPRPILLIIGGRAYDEASAAQHIAAGNSNVTIWAVPDAGHIQGLAVAPEEWQSRVVGFLDRALADSSPGGRTTPRSPLLDAWSEMLWSQRVRLNWSWGHTSPGAAGGGSSQQREQRTIL